jgi:hypothetical protein
MTTIAILDEAGATFTIRRGSWESTFPLSDLPKWIAFYQRQMVLFPDQQTVYAESVKALEQLQEKRA